ncbi:hypothetical protein [Arthrobacter sp. ISL-95]|uniref:hypothetical protein n=1 Tax=Arthrobacter sp. ISL-95 TaxID=2819116 RepID=UPI001BEA2514|nr:hypothetical protein [Arthrobacter sp. ISL-95]MBT2586493.1 hypothetical protein [Arthrobacter sp. ISL-95]
MSPRPLRRVHPARRTALAAEGRFPDEDVLESEEMTEPGMSGTDRSSARNGPQTRGQHATDNPHQEEHSAD